MARVNQMNGMLERHVKNTTNQFTYVEGQIIALSSQINDMRIEQQRQQQDDSESESKSF